ncbi:uncharacterized protein A4U43_C05F690 [Asparagus officinalis]|uniref:Beta-Casp domain-containing protein n=1 Tax=Asparagus officinalis TaxID=4686 RepID=A0A5P1ETV8_ASPOF|nr:uncharacterized protein A4U43_C05F690 [Asparagus officinalis]
MKLTCLSKEAATISRHALLHLSGHRLLLDCPLDLSPLTAFTPLKTLASQTLTLIQSLPRYKALRNLHLYDPSLIDAVLITTPAGMLGLPFLTRSPRFGGKVYATEAAARVGRLMMEELVAMHEEMLGFYGPEREEDGVLPEWLRWEEVERLPETVREVVMGGSGEEMGSWMPLYSAADIKECMQSVQPLKYAEEVCFNGTIVLKAFSSGLEIGSCNWTISGPRGSIAYLSSSIFQSAHAMDFDYHSLQGKDVVLFSDLSSLYSLADGNDTSGSNHDEEMEEKDLSPSDVSEVRASYDKEDETRSYLIDPGESSEENNKISFICSCVIDSLNEGGSVLIPVGRVGIILVLLEQLSQLLESSNLEVPIFMVSSTAEEMLAFTNAIPEWLCKRRQDKLFAGEALFGHVDLMRERKLNIFPLLYSPELLMMWREPCIVFAPHWSLRLGPVVHLLHRWHADHRCLLILEQGVDAEAALLPFKPVAIKVLQCSFLSGIKVEKIQPLLEVLRPKFTLLPEDLRSQCKDPNLSFLYYSENTTVCIPKLRENFEAFLATDLAFNLLPRRLTIKGKDMAIARLKGGRLLLRNGKYILVSSGEKQATEPLNKLYWGCIDPARLLSALKEKEINASLRLPSENEDSTCSTIYLEQGDDFIKISASQTFIRCADESTVARIYEAISTICDGI